LQRTTGRLPAPAEWDGFVGPAASPARHRAVPKEGKIMPGVATRADTPAEPAYFRPDKWTALGRGIRGRCPVCGQGKIFAGYLTRVDKCAVCEAPIGALKADDAPPYFVILLSGHLLVPWVFVVERHVQPPMWLHMVVWLPLFTLTSILLLRPVKGAVVGWMLALGITGQESSPMPSPPLVPPLAPAPGATRDA
jgi:uncharacterized protein (DUF983 family)